MWSLRNLGDALESVGHAITTVGQAVYSGAGSVGQTVVTGVDKFVQHPVGTASDIISGIARVTTVVQRGAFNLAEDAATRGYFALTNQLNWDIVKNGPQIQGVKDLQPGDLLLKQGGIDPQKLWNNFNTESHNLISLIIDGTQIVTNRSNHKYVGAGLLGHAAIYCGDGEIAEAIGSGATITELGNSDNREFNYYVIRSKNEQLRGRALAIAKHYASSGKIGYSHVGLITPVIGDAGTDALMNDVTKRERNKLDNGGRADMFCSEFAVFCYNCATDDLNLPRIFKKRQDRLSPEELYVHLRDDSGFSYVGELHKGVR